MRSPTAKADGAFRPNLTAFRRASIFLHFFDVHFLEEKAVEGFRGAAQAEARIATRLAMMLADQVLVPASSYIESRLCSQILNEFPPELFASYFTLVGSGASFDEFLEEKKTQYRGDQAQGIAYRAKGLGISLPWRTRGRSATADIATDWIAALSSGRAERVFSALHNELPRDAERRWEAIPDQLGSRAFIVENVTELLLGASNESLIVRNRLHGVVNPSYFGSYAKDLKASIFKNMIFLDSPYSVPSGSPDGDLDYRKLTETCRRGGVLAEIDRAGPQGLLDLRDDPRLAAAYASAHPNHLPDRNDQRADPLRFVRGWDAGKTETTLSDPHRVLIVTALPREAAAVLATFDSFNDAPSHRHDSNVYREGEYKMHDGSVRRVLLASMPTMGTDTAAGVGVNAFRTHPDLQYVLMVGIAGCCPNPDRPDEHVRLGDVIVSNAKGVFDYGHVKRTPAGDERRGSHQNVSPALLGLFQMLESEAMIGRRPWVEVIDVALSSPDAGRIFSRPSDDKDVLYRDENGTHVVVPHPSDPKRHPGEPRLHGGAIGTADILLKEPALRDELRDEYDVRAVEMESSGMQNAAWLGGKQFIAVRGACDYADTFKNDDWQHYAALAAAAVTRCLVERMPKEWFS